MTPEVRALTAQGIEGFRAWLGKLRRGEQEPAPRHLLTHSSFSRGLSAAISADMGPPGDRMAAARHLHEVLRPLRDAGEDLRDAGLWAWLSLHWFDEVCPPGPGKARRPGLDYRYIPEPDYERSYRSRHRHLLRGPYHVYCRYGNEGRVLLTGPLHRENQVYREVASRQDLFLNRGVIETIGLLYLEAKTGRLKRGCVSAAAPGGVRRLIAVLQQFDLTYDLFSLSGLQILQILPDPEFGRWLVETPAPQR